MVRLWRRILKHIRRVPWAWSWTFNTPMLESPPYLTRWRRRQEYSNLFIMLIWLVPPLLMGLRGSFGLQMAWHITFMLLMLTVVIAWIIAGNRMRMRLARQRFDVCMQCGYSLRGLDEQGACPECGTEYELVRVRQVWRAYLWHSRGGGASPGRKCGTVSR